MRRIFSLDGPLMSALSKFADIVLWKVQSGQMYMSAKLTPSSQQDSRASFEQQKIMRAHYRVKGGLL